MEEKEGCGGCRVVQDIPQDILQAARFSLYIYIRGKYEGINPFRVLMSICLLSNLEGHPMDMFRQLERRPLFHRMQGCPLIIKRIIMDK